MYRYSQTVASQRVSFWALTLQITFTPRLSPFLAVIRTQCQSKVRWFEVMSAPRQSGHQLECAVTEPDVQCHVSTGSPRFTRNRYTLFRLYAILLQRSIFTQVAVLKGGGCKMGDRSFICVLTLKVIAVLHTCIHTKTAEFH
jgi:hypothetical protein